MTHEPHPHGRIGLSTYCVECGDHLVLKRIPGDGHLGYKWVHVNDVYLNSEDPIEEEAVT